MQNRSIQLHEKYGVLLYIDVTYWHIHKASESFTHQNISCHQYLFFHNRFVKFTLWIDFPNFKHIYFFL